MIFGSRESIEQSVNEIPENVLWGIFVKRFRTNHGDTSEEFLNEYFDTIIRLETDIRHPWTDKLSRWETGKAKISPDELEQFRNNSDILGSKFCSTNKLKNLFRDFDTFLLKVRRGLIKKIEQGDFVAGDYLDIVYLRALAVDYEKSKDFIENEFKKIEESIPDQIKLSGVFKLGISQCDDLNILPLASFLANSKEEKERFPSSFNSNRFIQDLDSNLLKIKQMVLNDFNLSK